MSKQWYLAILLVLIVALAILYQTKQKNMTTEGFTNLKYNNLTNHSDAPWTIDKPTKLIITDIIRKILNKVNEQTLLLFSDLLGEFIL